MIHFARGLAPDVNNMKLSVDPQKPSSEVEESVKSALQNGSVSEVVIRKDLLLFPSRAPNYVRTQYQI